MDHARDKIQSWKRWVHVEKNAILSIVDFVQISKNWLTLEMHISLNFNPMRVFLDFLENLGCPLNNSFGFISI